MRFNLVVIGTPHSANNDNSAKKRAWVEKVRRSAHDQWAEQGLGSALDDNAIAKVEMIYYCKERKDVDNVIKYTIDGLRIPDTYLHMMRSYKKAGKVMLSRPPFHVFQDDGIVEDIRCRRVDLNAHIVFDEPSAALYNALESEQEFVQIFVSWEQSED